MCGRYEQLYSKEQLSIYFKRPVAAEAPDWKPSHNVAPTTMNPLLMHDRIITGRWSLIPSWAKGLKMSLRTYNARVEGLEKGPEESKLYQPVFEQGKVTAVPFNAFIEWNDDKTLERIPYLYSSKDGKLLVAAGLFNVWRGQDLVYVTYTIITVPATEQMGGIHGRMPLFLTDDQLRVWLSKDTDIAERRDILHTPPLIELSFKESDPRLNNSRYQPELNSL